MSKKSKERHQARTEYFEYLKETAEAVDHYVKEFIQSKYDTNPELMQKLMQRYRFGKPQLRPAQVRIAYELSGGNNWQKTIPACASVEAKDTGYYCYDDVLDSHANPDLILLGGIFSSMSYRMLNDLNSDFSANLVRKTIEELAELDSENANAVLIDLNLREPDMNTYLQKVKGYNFWERALRLGATLGKATNEELDAIGLAGRNIGMAYIIANDTWDFGKDLEDFRAGKYTFPNMIALSEAPEKDRQELEELFGQRTLTPDQIEKVRQIVVQHGVIEKGKQLAQEYCDKGLEILADFSDSRARRMIEFATTMTQRNKFYDLLKRYE
ncbi:MAG: polyprenyl synthetase family protein [Nanoarchaeota archaeon]|nr:polyprenyl synthetase family protein [Nanoarchaeota archaeon]